MFVKMFKYLFEYFNESFPRDVCFQNSPCSIEKIVLLIRPSQTCLKHEIFRHKNTRELNSFDVPQRYHTHYCCPRKSTGLAVRRFRCVRRTFSINLFSRVDDWPREFIHVFGRRGGPSEDEIAHYYT